MEPEKVTVMLDQVAEGSELDPFITSRTLEESVEKFLAVCFYVNSTLPINIKGLFTMIEVSNLYNKMFKM